MHGILLEKHTPNTEWKILPILLKVFTAAEESLWKRGSIMVLPTNVELIWLFYLDI